MRDAELRTRVAEVLRFLNVAQTGLPDGNLPRGTTDGLLLAVEAMLRGALAEGAIQAGLAQEAQPASCPHTRTEEVGGDNRGNTWHRCLDCGHGAAPGDVEEDEDEDKEEGATPSEASDDGLTEALAEAGGSQWAAEAARYRKMWEEASRDAVERGRGRDALARWAARYRKALEDLKAEYTGTPERAQDYRWSLTIIEFALAGGES